MRFCGTAEQMAQVWVIQLLHMHMWPREFVPGAVLSRDESSASEDGLMWTEQQRRCAGENQRASHYESVSAQGAALLKRDSQMLEAPHSHPCSVSIQLPFQRERKHAVHAALEVMIAGWLQYCRGRKRECVGYIEVKCNLWSLYHRLWKTILHWYKSFMYIEEKSIGVFV